MITETVIQRGVIRWKNFLLYQSKSRIPYAMRLWPVSQNMDMKKSRQELAGKKKALYAEYRKAQADMRQAVAVKANIDYLLGHTDGRENKAQER